MELFWNSLDNGPSSIVFYLEMKVEVEVGEHNIRSRFTPRNILCYVKKKTCIITLNAKLDSAPIFFF